ncbi:MAG: ABC transporter permease [Gammaproteobacteria bacterium]
MKLQHVRAVARKEWWHLMRDPRSLALILLMPTMLLFLFGYALSLDITRLPLGVLQQSHDATANAIISRFDGSNAFDVVATYTDRRQMEAELQAGKVAAVLMVPRELTRDLANGDATMQFILDGVDANSARLAHNYAQAIVNDYLEQRELVKLPIELEERTWFNEAKESRVAIVPGVIAVVMAVIGALMTSLTIAREMEQGNLVLLRTTALSKNEFLLGKLFPYFVIGMGDFLVATLAAVYLFDVPLRGSALGLTFVSALFLIVVMLQGALLSIVAGGQMLAAQMSLVSTFLPAFLLSGFVFAIQNMPQALQYLSVIVPARYYVELAKLIFLKGVSPLVIWSEVVSLLVIMLVLLRVVTLKARKLGLL